MRLNFRFDLVSRHKWYIIYNKKSLSGKKDNYVSGYILKYICIIMDVKCSTKSIVHKHFFFFFVNGCLSENIRNIHFLRITF